MLVVYNTLEELYILVGKMAISNDGSYWYQCHKIESLYRRCFLSILLPTLANWSSFIWIFTLQCKLK